MIGRGAIRTGLALFVAALVIYTAAILALGWWLARALVSDAAAEFDPLILFVAVTAVVVFAVHLVFVCVREVRDGWRS